MRTAELAARDHHSHDVPPGPRALRLVLCGLALRVRALETVTALAREHGELVHLPIRPGHAPVYLASNPAHVAQIFGAPDEFRKIRGGAPFLSGLLFASGESWRRQRPLTEPAFEERCVAPRLPRVLAAADALVRWVDSRAGASVELIGTLRRPDLASRPLLGDGLDDALGQRLARAVRGFFDNADRPDFPLPLPGWLPKWKDVQRERISQELHHVIGGVIDRRCPGSAQDDAFSTLGAARGVGGERLSENEIRDDLVNLATGQDQIARIVAFALHLLAANPAAQERVAAEADAVLPVRPFTLGELGRLTYTRMVVAEALRLFPIIWLQSRVALRPTEIGRHRVPRRSLILMSPFVVHRDPAHWERPDQFEPERFLQERAASRAPGTYFPFGLGRHACIAGELVMLEATIFVATAVRAWRLSVVPGRPVEPSARSLSAFLSAARGVHVSMTARKRLPARSPLTAPEGASHAS
jgi:enediyne biosynthesis protein E7